MSDKKVVKVTSHYEYCPARSVREASPGQHPRDCDTCGGKYFMVYGYTTVYEDGTQTYESAPDKAVE